MPSGTRAVQVVLLSVLLLLLVLLLGFLWFLPEPASSVPVPMVKVAGTEAGPEAKWVPRPRQRRSPTHSSPVVSSQRVETPPPSAVEALSVEGDTLFQRRLMAGLALRQLQGSLDRVETPPPNAGEEISVEGDTPFQRRLVAGLAFRRFQGSLDNAWRRIAEINTGTPAGRDQKDALARLSPGQIQDLFGILEPLSRPLDEVSDHLLEVEPRRRAWRNIWARMFHAHGIKSPRSPRAYEENAVRFLSRFLEEVLHPAADLDTLRLGTSSAPRDRLGTGALVRCWTRRETSVRDALSSSEIRMGEELLRQLSKFTAHSIPAGIDVLVTPELGADVFPRKLRHPWVVGLYHPGDRFCSVRSGTSHAYRKEVLKHELAHAFLHQFTPEFSQLSFIHEGLAEYLRHLGPRDEGLRIPIERFQDNFAALESLVSRLRDHVNLEQMEPGRLLRLSPRDYYALGHFTYRVAEAAMVFIGSPVVDQALSERSDRQIIAAVENIRWSEFLAFVEEHAARGDPARAVTIDDAGDLTGGGEMLDEGFEEPDPASVLARMGVAVQEGFSMDSAFFTAVHRERSDRESLFLLKEELWRGDAPVVLLRDVSERMDLPIDDSGRSRRDYIDEFLQWLQANLDRKSPITGVLAIETDPVRAEGQPFTASGVPDWLDNAKLRQANLVLCVGSRDLVLRERLGQAGGRAANEITSEDLARAYRELFQKGNVQSRAVLVVDAGGGDSDGLALARGIAASQPHGTLVVYWGPPEAR